MPGITADPITERTQAVKGRIGLFVAEHCLPYSISGPLLEFVKELCKDVEAVNSTKMERTACTYTITHGIARAVKKQLANKLKGVFFSLNIDEATNHAKDKVLNILVQFWDQERGKFAIELLGSRVVNIAKAENLFNAVDTVLEEYELQWDQVTSVLMDNCSVMRGAKSGVEARIKEKNPHMMDISGDTVHMINNSANAMFDEIEAFHPIQPVLCSIYFDIQDSPKMKSLFNSVQHILLGQSGCTLSILRPLPTRFLQIHEVAERILKLWDVLWIYYYGTLTAEEKKDYKKQLLSLFSKYDIDEGKQSELVSIWKLVTQHKSAAGVRRLDNIALFLFKFQDKSLLLLKLYKGILGQLKGYVLRFQSERPLAHTLHTSIFSVLQGFYKGFIKPTQIPDINARELAKLNYRDENIQLSSKSLSVGPDAYEDHMIMQKDVKCKSWLSNFHKALLKGYISGAEKLRNLPLTNKTLVHLSALSPEMQRTDSTPQALMNLAKSLPQVVPTCELGALDQELREYVTDRQMSLMPYDSDAYDTRIDVDWYCHLFSSKIQGQYKYPKLSKLVKAALSCFSGPIVEGTFNIMDDILEKDRTRMTAENFEALLSVKQTLKASGCTATTYPITVEMRNMISQAYAVSTKDKQTSSVRSRKRKAPISEQPLPSTSVSDQTLPSTSVPDQTIPSSSVPDQPLASLTHSSTAVVSQSPRPFKKTKTTTITSFFKKT